MDTEDFRGVVEQHKGMVFSIALRVVRDPGLAEEVAQDVFLELYRAGERFASDDHRRFWLRRVTVHRATDAIRRRKRQPESRAEEWMEEAHGGPGTGSEGSLDERTVHRLENMVGSLPEAMRVSVVLRYGEEMTPGEIGELLEQPVATVKSNLQRALKLLRQKAAVTWKGYIREH